MTQVAILLFTLVTAPAPAPAQVGQVVSGPGLRAGQRILSGQVLRAPSKGGPVAVLTPGGCLVRLTGGSRMSLSPPTGKNRCSQVRVLWGRVRLLAPKGKSTLTALTVVLGKHRVTLAGEAFARHDGVSGICVNRGLARHLTATAPSTAVPGTPATPTPRPAPRAAKQRQCLWLTASGATVGKYTEAPALADHKASAVSYVYRTPKAVLTVNLNQELASLTAALHSKTGGSGEVEGGGQSMCLDTGGEGSAADLGSSSVEVSKPPPPTRLRLILKLTRRGP